MGGDATEAGRYVPKSTEVVMVEPEMMVMLNGCRGSGNGDGDDGCGGGSRYSGGCTAQGQEGGREAATRPQTPTSQTTLRNQRTHQPASQPPPAPPPSPMGRVQGLLKTFQISHG